MYYLPVEAKLDIFKFLNINQITKLQQTNQHFFKLINKYQKELPRQKIYSIKITRGECYGNLINPESGVFKFKLRDELNEEDCSRIALNDSLFTQHGVPLCYSYNKMKRVVILIKMKDKEFILCLPNYPKNIEKMCIVYCWLYKLSLCFFEEIEFDKVIFNPKMLQILFGEDNPIQFYCENIQINLYDRNYRHSLITLFHDNFVIYGTTKLEAYTLRYFYQEAYEEIIPNLLLKEGNKIPKIIVKDSIFISSFFGLHNKLINYAETSTDCLNIVAEINFENIKWSVPKFSNKAKKIKEMDCHDTSNLDWSSIIFPYLYNCKYSKYEIANIHNPKIKFSITFWQEIYSEFIYRFQIKRINK